MRRFSSILLGMAPLWIAGLAHGQATPEPAAELQRGLTEILTPTLAGPGPSAVFEGGWTVGPGPDGRLWVTGPALSILIRDDQDGQKRVVRVRCDGERYTAAVPAAGSVWRLSGDTPQRCEIRPGEALPPVAITSRSRQVDLTLDLATRTVTTYADEQKGVTFTTGGHEDAAIDTLRIAGAAAPREGAGRQDLAMRVEAEGIRAGGLTLAKARYSGRMDDVDTPLLKRRVWQLLEFGLNTARRDPHAPEPPNRLRKAEALANQLLAALATAGDSEVALTGLRGDADGYVTQIDSVMVAAGYRGFVPDGTGAGLGGSARIEVKGVSTGGPAAADPIDALSASPDVKIDRLLLSATLDPAAEGQASSLGYGLEIDGLEIAGAGGTSPHITLAKGRYRGRAGVDIPAAADAVRQARRDVTQIELPRDDGSLPPPGSPDDLKAQLTPFLLLRRLFDTVTDYEMSVQVDQLMVDAQGTKVSVASAGYDESYQGLRRDDGTAAIKLGLAGLAISPPPPFADWIPTDATVALSSDGLPYRPLLQAYWARFAALMPPSDMTGIDSEQVEAQLAVDVLGILRNSAVHARVDTFTITAPKAAVDLAGAARADKAAAHGVVADARLRLTGFDAFIKYLSSSQDADDRSAAAGFTMFQMIGRQAETAAGQAARDYDIVVDAGGKVLVNGTDFATLIPND